MARIRTIKPEAFASESLATVSLAAERTFFGLLTQADDHGRFRDQPAVIAGLLWSLRPEHNPVDVDDDLNQLAAAHLICRYAGDDGKRYLHIVTWRQHQKINRPSGVRFPACPHHDVEQHSPDAPQTHGDGAESSMSTPGGLSEGSRTQQVLSDHHKTAAQSTLHEYSASPHVGLSEPSASPHGPDLGPRNLDLGTTSPSGGADAPAPETVSTQQLMAEYAAACTHRPPSGVLGHLGRETAKLLAEGIDPAHIRAGLARHRTKGLHPSTLPSLVHEAMNATPAGLVRTESRPNVPGHRAWANPADPAAAYAEEL
ncbi:hypothetical protein FNV60_28580 [Streptomyces sp. RLB3-5]|uniref:hypothetical protein n=1 Tax=unclassified Streptomyces TaxID=2593676 RepID=UPI0011623671|nr:MULTISPECIES: hypothetical protein [unclassified Streptomyces]QDO51666.1 hypothetical protein FNV60_28580 [Streptomyces sp. RLB3-5]QDO61907.1 hypothetical protein FNV59_30825 [Streptomyces sp. RLB1-8]